MFQDVHDTTVTVLIVLKIHFDRHECLKTFTTRGSRHDDLVKEAIDFLKNISRRSRQDVHDMTFKTRCSSNEVIDFFSKKKKLDQREYFKTFTTRRSRHDVLVKEAIDFFLNISRRSRQDVHDMTYTNRFSRNEVIDFFKTQFDQCECFKTSTTRRSRHDVLVKEAIDF